MDKLKQNLPMIVLIIIELAIGILLLINGEVFTKIVIILFGLILIALGIVYLIRSFTASEKGFMSWIAMPVSIVALVVGLLCTFFSGAIMGVLAVVAVVYGVILIISAIFKLKSYVDVSRAGLKPSALTLISAALSFVFGAIIILNPFKAVNALWIFSGISLIIQAVVDIAMIVLKEKMGV